MITEENQINFPTIKELYQKYASVIFGLLICAAAFNLFFVPTNIIYGGANGLAIAINTVYHTGINETVAVVWLVMLLLGFAFLEKKYISKAIIGSILYPLFVFMTADIGQYIIIDYTSDLLLIYTFGAIIFGFGLGLIYKRDFSSGGIDILKHILHQKFDISMGKTSMVVNGAIVIIGAFITNSYENIMYSMVILYIIGFMADRVILGISEQKVFQIVTAKEEEIKRFVIDQLGHNVTIFNVKGGYLNQKGNILLCLIPTKQYFLMKEAIKEIDPNAFFVVSDAYESVGGK